MTRVLSLIHFPAFGGPHNRNMRLAPLLKDAGTDIVVGIPDDPGDASQRLRAAGLEVVTFPLHRIRESLDPRVQWQFLRSSLYEVKAIQHLIARLDIDLVQINGLVNPHGAIAARREGVPLVWQILDTRTPMVARRLLMPYVVRTADVIMTDGPTVASLHPGANSLGRRSVAFFPPVDTDEFRPDAQRRQAARTELQIPDGVMAIGSVANLNPQKGHEVLIEALAILKDRGRAFRCAILGASSPEHATYARKLAEKSQRLGLSDGALLRFIDPGIRVPSLLPAFDVFVRTSVPRSEGTSTSILEAMSVGLPVVSSDVGGIRDAVEHCRTGLLVPPMDPVAVANGIATIIDDDAVRSSMATNARSTAVARFAAESCAESHLDAYTLAFEWNASRRSRRRTGTD